MDRGLESLLSLPPNQRITGMEILWVDIDVDRLVVLAWMMPNEVDGRDATGATHRLTRATLIRDTFQKTAGGWRRIQHQKLLPNGTVLAVDGKPQIVPPLSEASQVR